MIEGLKPYAEYKASDLPWIGKIPKHWDVKRFKYLLSEINTRSLDGHEQLLRVSQYTGVTPRLSLNGDNEPDTRAESLVGYKQVTPGDLVVNIMLAWNGSLGVARSAGIVSPAYCVYRFNDHVEPWYYHNLLRIPLYKGRIKVDSTGVIESRLRLYSDKLFSIEAILPGREEQASIARFVEAFSRRVDRIIRDKRWLIELLNEQKQAIINRAVTRGIDPNVCLKPSGIEWLGDIPEHWEVWKIGQFATVGNGSTPSRGNASYWSNSEYPWLNSASVNQFTITKADQFVTELALRECHLPKVQPGSVLVAITGQGKTRGTAAVLNIEATINQHMVYISPRTAHLFSDYLQMFLIAAYTELRSISNDSGSTKGALTCEAIKHFKVALPPTDEQHRLVRAVRQEFAKNEATVMRVRHEIDLLREYRTRLISDVVTGKLDVRGVELPAMDEAEVPEDIEIGEETEAEELIESEEEADADN